MIIFSLRVLRKAAHLQSGRTSSSSIHPCWKLICLLTFFYLFPDTARITTFITNTPSPSYAAEGQNLTLVWTYTLDGTVGLAKFNIITDSGSELLIGKKFGPGVITVQAQYQARFRAQATNTRAELNIFAVQRSDEAPYRINVFPSGSGSLVQSVVLIVNCKYWLKQRSLSLGITN